MALLIVLWVTLTLTDFDSLAEVSNYSYHTLSYVVPGSQGFKGTHFTLLGVDF